MEGIPVTLDYQGQVGSGLRWGRMMAGGSVFLVASVVELFAQILYSFVLRDFLSLVAIWGYAFFVITIGFVSAGGLLAGGILLVRSHPVRPGGEGMTLWRRLALILLAAYFGLVMVRTVVIQVALNWLSPSTRSSIIMLLQWNYILLLAMSIGLYVAICLYMRRVSVLCGRTIFFRWTVIAAAMATVIRLGPLALSLARSYVPGFDTTISSLSSVYVNQLLAASGALNTIVYWIVILRVARSTARRERSGMAAAAV